MEKFKAQKTSEKIFTVLLTILLFAFLGLVFYVNLNDSPSIYDADMYSDLKYAKAAWNSKSIFPDNWVFGNQVYVFATPVLAALFYGITSNRFLAIGIASCCMTVLIVLTFDWMLKPLYTYNQRIGAFLAFAMLVLMKGSVTEELSGAQLFFTMASYYACYLISAFITFGSYIRLQKDCFKKSDLVSIFIAVILSYALGIQSLRQTAVMVLPLTVCEGLNVLVRSIRKKKLTLSKTTVFTGAILFSNIAGLVTLKVLNINQHTIYESNLADLLSGNLAERIINSFKDMCKLFSPNFTQPISGYGYLTVTWLKQRESTIQQIVGVIAVAFIVSMLIICLLDVIKAKQNSRENFFLFLVFVLSGLSVFAIEILNIISVRDIYYFMLLPLVAVSFAYFLKIIKPLEKAMLTLVMVATVFLVSNHFWIETEFRADEENFVSNQSFEIAEYLINNNYECVFSPFMATMDIAIASDDRIDIIFFADKSFADKNQIGRENAVLFAPINYLCIKDEYKKYDNEKSLYYICKDGTEIMFAEAKKYGVDADVVYTLKNGDMLCKMSENICAKVAQTEEE